jgi:Predicted membrane protein
MKRLVLILPLVLMSLAAPALAESFPHYADVSGVAADDVLNIRAEPSALAPIIGVIPPDTTLIEVTGASEDGKWRRLNAGERSGWVSARYLEAEPMPPWWTERVPLFCYGTEPFWSVSYEPGLLSLEMPGEEPRSLGIEWSGAPQSGAFETIGWKIRGGGADGFSVLRNRECSDGMSDRKYAIGIDFFLRTPEEDLVFTGCCALN